MDYKKKYLKYKIKYNNILQGSSCNEKKENDTEMPLLIPIRTELIPRRPEVIIFPEIHYQTFHHYYINNILQNYIFKNFNPREILFINEGKKKRRYFQI